MIVGRGNMVKGLMGFQRRLYNWQVLGCDEAILEMGLGEKSFILVSK